MNPSRRRRKVRRLPRTSRVRRRRSKHKSRSFPRCPRSVRAKPRVRALRLRRAQPQLQVRVLEQAASARAPEAVPPEADRGRRGQWHCRSPASRHAGAHRSRSPARYPRAMAARCDGVHAASRRSTRLCQRVHRGSRDRHREDRFHNLQSGARPPPLPASTKQERPTGCRMVRIRATSAAIVEKESHDRGRMVGL